MKRENLLLMRADVEGERRPAVLAHRDEPVIELDLRGAQVGLVPRAFADADERVHFFRSRGPTTPRGR